MWLRATGFLGLALVLAGLPGAAGEMPPDALVLLTVEGRMQLWWPEESWLVNLDLSGHLGLEKPAPFERVAVSPGGILVLDRQGRVYSVLERRLLFEIPPGGGGGVDLLVDRSERFFWVLSTLGGLYPVHFSGAVIGPALVLPAAGELCALGQDPEGRLWAVDTDGTLTSPEDVLMPAAEPFGAKIVDLGFHTGRFGGLVLDGSGELYAWAEALGEGSTDLPNLERRAAVGLEFSASATDDYYVLDRGGSLFYSGTGSTDRLPETASLAYADLAVAASERLDEWWRQAFPVLSVWIEPPRSPVPSWRSSLRFEVMCGPAQDLSQFDCQLAFDPEILRPGQLLPGELFQPSGRRPVVLDDSRWEEGILGVLGVSLDKRSGSGITGSGSLFGVEMEILRAGASKLSIEQFRAASPSLPGAPVDVTLLGEAQVRIYSAQPSIHLSFQPLSSASSLAEAVVPQLSRRVFEGERFNVYLQVDHVKAMKGLRYDLSFDEDMVEFITVEEGDFLSRQGQPTLLLSDPVKRSGSGGWHRDQGIVILGQGPGCSGPGEIVRYLFEARRAGITPICLKEATLVDEERTRKPLEVSSAQVEVEIVRRP